MRVAESILVLSASGIVSGAVAVDRQRSRSYRRRYKRADATPAQQEVRDAFGFIDRVWRNLGPGLQQAWRDWESWRPNFGYNRFQKVNIPRRLAGLPLITDPVTIHP
ncbi:hypothetical protein LCGC14_1650620 [marine sediment metagenome]|uniref:Uncharacterized protein n=1 Tax=marine sediment metagenome TaxID=412755 RepID=A0A0F9KX37_9ZZZZ